MHNYIQYPFIDWLNMKSDDGNNNVKKKCHQRAFVWDHTNTLNIDINFSMNDMQRVFTRIITTVLARRRRQCDYVWLYMPRWGRQSLWIRLDELNWRQAHRPQYSQEWRSHISSTYQALYLHYKREERAPKIFTHKIVCFVIIFDLLRSVVLSYKQEENLCILRRRDVLSLHFLFLFFLPSFHWRSLVYCSHTTNFWVNENEKKKLNHLINLKIFFCCLSLPSYERRIHTTTTIWKKKTIGKMFSNIIFSAFSGSCVSI